MKATLILFSLFFQWQLQAARSDFFFCDIHVNKFRFTRIYAESNSIIIRTWAGKKEAPPTEFKIKKIDLDNAPDEKVQAKCETKEHTIKLWENYAKIDKNFYALYSQTYDCKGTDKVNKDSSVHYTIAIYEPTKPPKNQDPLDVIVSLKSAASIGIGKLFEEKKRGDIFTLEGREKSLPSVSAPFFELAGNLESEDENILVTTEKKAHKISLTQKDKSYSGTIEFKADKKKVSLICTSRNNK